MKMPIGWSIKSLDELVELDVEMLSAVTPRDFSFYYLDISAASQGRLSIPAVATDFFEAPSRARKVVQRGDVLMSMVRPNLKAFALFDQALQPCVASTGFSVLRSKPETCAAFVLYSILSEDVSNQIDALVTGSNYPAINSTAIRALKILAPSKGEQTKIAEILSTVDLAIEQTESLIAKQQRIKTGLMQDLLTRGIDEHGQLRTEQTHAFKDSPLGRIPAEWEVKAFENVAEISRGKFTHRPRNDPAFFEGNYPFVQTGDITGNIGRQLTQYSQTLNEKGMRVSKEFPAGTIAITIAANIADTAILGIPMCFPDSVVGAVIHQILSDCVVNFRFKRDLQLRANAVRRRD